jgi:hypothetical protein
MSETHVALFLDETSQHNRGRGSVRPPAYRNKNDGPPASFNTQYQLARSPKPRPIVNFCSAKFLISFAVALLTFFIVGLLYLLRFERVDNLGAYSIPSKTGPLIPFDYVSSFLAAG